VANRIEVTLVLRMPKASEAIAESLLAGSYATSETTQANISADPSDVKAVSEFAKSHNLQIVKTDSETRSIRVSGSVSDIRQAFGIASSGAQEGGVESLNYKGDVNLPAEINHIVIAVLGLNQSPVARHHVK
jgi:kumamolisin